MLKSSELQARGSSGIGAKGTCNIQSCNSLSLYNSKRRRAQASVGNHSPAHRSAHCTAPHVISGDGDRHRIVPHVMGTTRGDRAVHPVPIRLSSLMLAKVFYDLADTFKMLCNLLNVRILVKRGKGSWEQSVHMAGVWDSGNGRVFSLFFWYCLSVVHEYRSPFLK